MTTSDKISLVFNEPEAKLYVDGLILLAAIVNNEQKNIEQAIEGIIESMKEGEYNIDNLLTLLKQVEIIGNHFIRRGIESLDKSPNS
jgi:hypothetical protein